MASMELSVKVLVVLSMRLIFRDITNEESIYELAVLVIKSALSKRKAVSLDKHTMHL